MNGPFLALLCVGAAQLAGQTALLRLLLSFTGGNELIIGWALAVWLSGGALGAMLVRNWQRGFWPATFLFAFVLAGTAFIIPSLFPSEPDAFVVLHPLRLLLNCCVLFPVAIFGGMLFPLGMKLADHRLPRRYAADALGAIFGALLTLWLLAGREAAGQLTGHVVIFALALLLLFAPLARRLPLALPLLAIIWIFVFTVFMISSASDIFPSPLRGLETANGFIQQVEQGGQTAFYGNRQLLGVWPPASADRELALLPPAFAAAAPIQLHLGGSFSPLADEARRFGHRQIVSVEADAALANILLFIRDNSSENGTASRNGFVADDPRRYISAAAPADVIIIAGGAPESIADNRLFTTEFFALARQRLAPGGVLAFALAVSENYLTPLQRQLVAAEVASLRAAGFATVGLYPMSRLLVVATPAAALPDPATVLQRLAAHGISDGELSVNFPNAAEPLRQDLLWQALATVPATPNTDARPLSGLLTLSAWLALFANDSNISIPAWSARTALAVALLIILLLLAVILSARRPAPARALPDASGYEPRHPPGSVATTAALITTGAAAMTTHLLLMVVYQTRCGTLFYELGLLNAGFMLGGALAAAAPRLPPRLLPPLAAAVAALSPLLLLFAAPGLLLALSLIVLNGWTCGGLFLRFAAQLPDGSSRGYAADLLGAAPAALLALPLVMPLLSIPLTALLAGLLALLTLPALPGRRPGHP